VIYDLHTLQNRFYLHGNAIASLQTSVPLLLERLSRLSPTAPRITCVAFPDDGAAKRFGYMFKNLQVEVVTCGRSRNGEPRVSIQVRLPYHIPLMHSFTHTLIPPSTHIPLILIHLSTHIYPLIHSSHPLIFQSSTHIPCTHIQDGEPRGRVCVVIDDLAQTGSTLYQVVASYTRTLIHSYTHTLIHLYTHTLIFHSYSTFHSHSYSIFFILCSTAHTPIHSYPIHSHSSTNTTHTPLISHPLIP
jgi:phosphoribosylpyrophosphate synthetase